MKNKFSGNPFGELLQLEHIKAHDGFSRTELTVQPEMFNPHGVLHGGVVFSLVDTCMGRALYTLMTDEESCATIEIKINFMRPVTDGQLLCETQVLHRGRTTAVLESKVTCNAKLVAKAQGTYALFPVPIEKTEGLE